MPPGNVSILIVEDDAAALASLCNLTSMRYPDLTVHRADNGRSGLEAFSRQRPDIVVTDISMPVLSGICMAAEIRSFSPDVPIIALTSHSDKELLLRSIEISMDGYLLKPLACDKLFALIDKHLALLTQTSLRKQLEQSYVEQLRLVNELLEQRVNERTADLQAAMREQEAFSYSVSHDLRAPLRHINSFSAILMEEFAPELSAPAQGYLERIRSASNRMGGLIDDLLELSRVGRAQLKREPVNVSEMTASILTILQETEPLRAVKSSVEDEVHVLGDRALLRQLLENLLGNAWKYTSKTEAAHIEFGSFRRGAESVIYVKDNGAGFDMQYKNNLFVAFQRLHNAEFEGDGIGLTTAQRIIQRHGGNIWAEGEVGKGATFYFTLPS